MRTRQRRLVVSILALPLLACGADPGSADTGGGQAVVQADGGRAGGATLTQSLLAEAERCAQDDLTARAACVAAVNDKALAMVGKDLTVRGSPAAGKVGGAVRELREAIEGVSKITLLAPSPLFTFPDEVWIRDAVATYATVADGQNMRDAHETGIARKSAPECYAELRPEAGIGDAQRAQLHACLSAQLVHNVKGDQNLAVLKRALDASTAFCDVVNADADPRHPLTGQGCANDFALELVNLVETFGVNAP